MSFFKRDLLREQQLSIYLDSVYKKLDLDFERVKSLKLQHKGVDLIYHAFNKDYFIDEKAQLNYINKSLPTFTFEISYLKNTQEKIGWFMDATKITTHYFLVTNIYAFNKNELTKGFKKCTITSVNKRKLQSFLHSIGLTHTKLKHYNESHRNQSSPLKKTPLKELNFQKEGCFTYSPHLSEKPINLQLRLAFMIEKGIAKKII